MSDRRKSPLDSESVEPHMCSPQMRLDILSQVPFFKPLKQDKVAAINRLFRERGYLPGETIYFAGDPAEHLFVLADGKVKLLRHNWTGKDVLLDLLTPGEFFGSLSSLGDDAYAETAQAQTPVCALTIQAEDFRSILDRHPAAALAVLDLVSERLRAAHETIRQLSAHSVEQRIAQTLLKLGEKLGEQQEIGLLIQVPLSRDDLAQMTGTTPETASRVMSRFQKEGLIESGREWVAITDWEALTALAESGLG